jgi:hypothetical protein
MFTAGTEARIPSRAWVATPSDTVLYENEAAALWVGTTGNLTLVLRNGLTIAFTNVPVGYFPFCHIGVKATGTTAAGLVAVA